MVFELFILVLIAGMLLTSTQTQQYDLLIKRGRIVDGSGRAAYTADLAVKGDRIAAIGNLSQASATRTIDAWSRCVSASSICSASPKPICLSTRSMSKVMMGVTTEINGEGESIAPINERQIREQESFLRRYNLTVDWRTLDGLRGPGLQKMIWFCRSLALKPLTP